MSKVKREHTVSAETAFKGRLIDVEVATVRLDGGREARREIVRHRGAVAVLARLPDGRYVFVRQYRKAVERELLEVVAGGMEEGEEPAACAIREVREETGYAVRALRALGRCYPAPGYTDEVIHLFLAELEPQPGDTDPDDDEGIDAEVMTAASFEDLIRAGRVEDAKTLAAWLLAERGTADA